MEYNVLIIEDFDVMSSITDSSGVHISPEDLKESLQEAMNAFPKNAFTLREEVIVIDDADYTLFIISDDPDAANYDPSLLEDLSNDLDALVGDENWYPESPDPAVIDVIEKFLDGDYSESDDEDEPGFREADEESEENGIDPEDDEDD